MWNQLKEHLWDIITAQIKYHNQKHKFQIYVIEDKILLIMKNLQTIRFSKKLDNQWVELFKIKKIVRKQAYQLRLSRHYKSIYSTFHVSLLKSYQQWLEKKLLESLRVMINDHMKWVVKRILDRQLQWDKVQYLVKWNEYSDSENIWKSAEHLKAAQQLDVYKAVNFVIKKHSRWWNSARWMRKK